MSYSKDGPYVRCLACDLPVTSEPLKAPKDEEHLYDYGGCYEDVCHSCKMATDTAYHLSYEQLNGYFDFSMELGEAYK